MDRVKQTQYLKSLTSFIVSVLLLVLLTSITACKKEEPLIPIWETLGVEKEEYIINRMEERYGHEFIFLEDEPLTSASGEDVFIVKSTEFPDRITVYLNHKTGDIHDSYLKYYLRDEVEEELSKVVGEVYEDYKVFYSTGGDSLIGEHPEMTVDEYIKFKSDKTGLAFVVLVEDENYLINRDRQVNELRLELKENEIVSDIIVYYLLEGELENMDHNEKEVFMKDIHKENRAYTRGGFTMGNDYEFSYEEWREYR